MTEPPLSIPMLLAQTADGTGDEGGLLRWLLGLDRIDPTAESVVLSWQYELPPWLWVVIVAGAIALAWLSYRRLMGRTGGRLTLTAVRAAGILLIAALLAGPALVLPRENVEPDQILMLVDRSRSMAVTDERPNADPASSATNGNADASNTDDSAGSSASPARISRHRRLVSLIGDHANIWSQLAEDHQLDWLGFAETLRPITPPTSADNQPLPQPTGEATAIRTALAESVRRAAGRPIGGIVLLSDGRSSETLGPETWQLLNQLGVPVFPVPLGSPDAPPDLAIQRVEAPDRAFVDDTVPISIALQRLGGDNGETEAPPDTLVRLVDESTGQTLDEQTVSDLSEPIRLMTTPEAAGPASWRVELVTSQPEMIQQNNRRSVELTLVDRPIRLLYIDGYPRWSYRYLKNLAVREDSIDSSIMLISADRTFAQEGDTPLQRLPNNEEELRPYDVIAIGDVASNFFSSGQLQLIREHVASRGAGLLWIAGPRFNPADYPGTPLAELLPFSGASSASRLPAPIEVSPTPAAEALGVLRLRDSDGDESAGWPEGLPTLRWALAIDSPKPTAEPLAIDANTELPLVMRMRFGAGQSLFVATDETWRWRYGRGELYEQQFWMQLIRLLARSRLQSGVGEGQRARLNLSSRRAATGETIVVELTIADQSLLDALGDDSHVELELVPRNEDGSAAARAATQRRTIVLSAAGDRPGRYRGSFTAETAGRWTLQPVSPALGDAGLDQPLRVDQTEDELRNPAANHELLAELAERTGGRVLTADQLDQLPRAVPNRARITPADITEPLNHSPLAFALLIALFAAEWIGRRTMGLA